jgi:hypothetical protein
MTAQSSQQIDLDDMRADPRFSHLDGRGSTVVVMDSGAHLDHPFFGPDADNNGVADRIVYQDDYVANDSSASDEHDHGSNVASIVGSQDPTHRGMAPGVNLIILRTHDNLGNPTFAALEEAMRWVVDNAAAFNVVAVNMSFGAEVYNAPHLGYFGEEAAKLVAQDVAVVAAAGNNWDGVTSGVNYPAADPSIWAVSFDNGFPDNDTQDQVYFSTSSFTLPSKIEIGRAWFASGPVTLTGNELDNFLYAGAGNDTLRGEAGDDTLEGGAGEDDLSGGIGADVMRGGAHNDTYLVSDRLDTVVELRGRG